MEKIAMLLREHFSSGICIVAIESENEQQEQVQSCYHGGVVRAVGLCDIGKIGVIKRGKSFGRE